MSQNLNNTETRELPRSQDDSSSLKEADEANIQELPVQPTTVRDSEEVLKWSTRKSLSVWLLICYSVCLILPFSFLFYLTTKL